MNMAAGTFFLLVYIWMAIALVIFPVLLFIKAPYGRHISKSWGPLINNNIAWTLMEAPSLLVFGYFFLSGTRQHELVTWIFFALWMIHYLNRTFIFPLRLRTHGKKMPVSILLMGICFNLMNGFINGYYLGTIAPVYPLSWLWDIRFVAGILIFVTGIIINWRSDSTLINLRSPGRTGYSIPRGGLFRYISCPNHFGEIVEWAGFAIMVWSLPALAFAIWSFVNLVPRSLQHHKWYKSEFPGYPKGRKAIVPFIL